MNYGNYCKHENQISESVDIITEALKISDSSRDKNFFQIQLFTLLAEMYFDLDDYENFKLNSDKVLTFISKTGDSDIELERLKALGFDFLAFDNIYEAGRFFDLGLSIVEKSENIVYIASFFMALAVYFFKKGKNGDSKKYFNKGLEFSNKITNKKQLCYVYCNFGLFLSHMNESNTAMKYTENALLLAIQLNLKDKQVDILGTLGDIYKELKNYEDAKNYYEQAKLKAQEIHSIFFENYMEKRMKKLQEIV